MLGNVVTNDARCTSEIKYNFAITIAAFKKKKFLFSGELDVN